MLRIILTTTALVLPFGHAGSKRSLIAAIQPVFPRIDVFGIAHDNSIWHTYDEAGNGSWTDFDSLMVTTKNIVPAVTSWNETRLDIFYVRPGGAVMHSYTSDGGQQWSQNGNISSPSTNSRVAAVARDIGIIDVVARVADSGAYAYRQWLPETTSDEHWHGIGGNFASAPAIASWASDRLDVVGIDAQSGSLFHRFAYKAHAGDKALTWAWEWQDLGSNAPTPFIGDPVISTWDSGRLDVWAVAGGSGKLYHKYLHNRGGDWWEWSSWENLGGNFSTAPVVTSWEPGKLTIVGKFANDTQYRQKDLYEDSGKWWHPSVEGWYEKGGDFAGQPAVVSAKGKNWIYIFGVDAKDKVKFQLFDGTQWLPSNNEYYDLGEVPGVLVQQEFVHQGLKA